jgi:cytochrome bd-type quinol oxidase subunit 2
MAQQASDLSHVLLALAVLLATINFTVCVAVFRSGYYTLPQALMQTVLVWLLPVIGAIGIGMFLRSQRSQPDKYSAAAAFFPEAANVGGAPGPGGGQHAP